jgi:hypothetical protein
MAAEPKNFRKYHGYDDDENSLVNQLVTKDNLNECYRILFKLISTNGDGYVWKVIIKVFLDFYAELNPKMEQFIFKLKREQNQHKNKNMLFAYIIKNMFIRKSISNNVYNARAGVHSYKYTLPIFKNKKEQTHDKQINDSLKLIEIIRKYGNKYSVLLNALHSKNIDKVAYKIFTHLNDGDDVDILHGIIVSYFSFVYFSNNNEEYKNEECNNEECKNEVCKNEVCKNEVCNNEECKNEVCNNEVCNNEVCHEPNKKIFEKWFQIKENITSDFYLNYLIAIVIHLFADEININESLLFVRPSPDIIQI